MSNDVNRFVWHGPAAANLGGLHDFDEAVRRRSTTFTYYRSLTGAIPVNFAWEAEHLAAIARRGVRPILTLQLRDSRLGVDQPAYSHERILAGDHDDALIAWAQTIASIPGTVTVRLMHEGNGDWYPWCAGSNGNTTESYKAAFRHVRILMAAQNARWQWSMNKTYLGVPNDLAKMYPGHDVVHSVGLSGYNGGTAMDRGGWRSFAETFEPTITRVRSICTKPLYIAETACTEHGGNKAMWITDMWNYIDTHPEIAGLTWFNTATDEGDWPVTTTCTAWQAYIDGLASVS